jgi:hypothetical protein
MMPQMAPSGGFGAPQLPPPENSNRKWMWIGGGAVLLLGTCGLGCVGFVGLGVFLERRTSALEAACNGSPVPEAASYTAGARGPIVAMNRTDSGWSAAYDIVPHGFVEADTTEEAALVLCVEPDQTATIEPCSRAGYVYAQRTRHQRSARLVIARTGQTLSQGVATGADPPACADLVHTSDAEGPALNESSWTTFLQGALH